METPLSDEYFMRRALKEAQNAFDREEIPIGAVIVADNQVIAKGSNSVEQLNDVTAHAEILAITSAEDFLGSKYLTDCTLYVTIEPCIMCAGAIYWSHINRLVFGAYDEKAGFSKFAPSILNQRINVTTQILETDCSQLMKSFFTNKR